MPVREFDCLRFGTAMEKPAEEYLAASLATRALEFYQ
jgi:hypothetical protein